MVKIAHQELLKGGLVRSKEKLILAQAKLYEMVDNEELKIIIDCKIEAAGRAAIKKSNNDHRMRLRSLLLHAGQQIPEKLKAAATSSLSLRSGLVSDLSVEPDLSVCQTPPVSPELACTTSTPA